MRSIHFTLLLVFTVTMVAHYGYGFGCGILYAACQQSGSLGRGVVFGLTIWAVNYLGLLPAVGLYRTATQQPWRRNALMIAAHVVWGTAFGVLDRLLRKRFGKR